MAAMHLHCFPGTGLLALGLLGIFRLCAAPAFELRHTRDLALQPPGVRLEVTATSAAGRFRIGERIPLRLQFSSTLPNTYHLNPATYDRSGRLPIEEFVMEQDDVADPWRDYFGSSVMGGLVGGLRSLPPVLGPTPYEIPLDLNDWFRFDRAGRYRFYLKSHRLGELAAVSNVVEVEVVDDPPWREAQLARLRARMEQSDETVRQELRTLGTSGAVELALEMARLQGIDPLLLVGARDRAHAVGALDRYLAEEGVVIGEQDIRLRALFTFVQRWALPPLPTTLWQLQDRQRLPEMIAEAERRQGLFARVLREEAVRLIPVALKKQGEARKYSAREIGALAMEEARRAGLVAPENYGLTRAELIAGFATFEAERQSELLDVKWDLVRGAEMIPVLVKTTLRAEKFLGAVMMERLRELSPAAAWDLAKRELESGNLSFAAAKEFPAVAVPGADAALLRGLREDLPTALPLVARFGTAALAEPMRELLQRRFRSCNPELEIVTYFVRVFPAVDGEGREVLRTALRDRERRACHQWLLAHMGRVVWNAAVQAEAIEALRDTDEQMVQSAALALAEQGDATVEEPLWRRLERAEPELAERLIVALGSARSWRLDEGRRKRLVGFCPDAHCRQRWAGGRFEIAVSNGGSMYPPAFRVEEYTARTMDGLKQKLLQYPAGTTFHWCPQESNPIDRFSPGTREEMYQAVGGYLRQRGMTLVRCAATAPGRN